MARLITVPIDQVQPNPHRHLDKYPWDERKLKALQHSIEDVGLWESIIAREHEGAHQMAFGHHRLEAARRAGITEVSIISKDLTDVQMLQYMGRENGEDYSTNYLIMLNTWEGAVLFLENQRVSDNSDLNQNKVQPLDIARVIGWVMLDGKGYEAMSRVAIACNAGHKLIEAGYLSRSDLDGLTVTAAKDIVSRAQTRIDQIDKVAQKTKRPKKEVDAAKSAIASGAVQTAEAVRQGNVASTQIRAAVDTNAHKAAVRMKEKATPLFAVFGKALATRINHMLSDDASTDHLNEIVDSLHLIDQSDDQNTVTRIDFELIQLGKRTDAWREQLVSKAGKVTPISQAKKGIAHAN